MALALRTRLSRHPLKYLLPENFFPTIEPYDIYDEAAFPHEWNYGLFDFPLPLHLSVSDNPREGDLEFEYSPDRPGWDDVWHQPEGFLQAGYFRAFKVLPSKRKKRKKSPRLWMRKNLNIPVDARIHNKFLRCLEGSKNLARIKSPSNLQIQLREVSTEPVNDFPPPNPPLEKSWHYIWQTKKVLACTGKGCSLCSP